MKLSLKKNGSVFFDILPLVLFLVTTIIVTITCRTEEIHYDDGLYDITDGWVSSDGESISLNDLPVGDVVLTHDLSGVSLDRKRLCFKSTHTHVKAEFDGVTIYEYAPVQKNILGKSYGMYMHLIPIPPDAENVTLTLHPIYSNSAASVEKAAVEDAGMFMADIYYYGLPSFGLCMLIFLFGILMLLVGIPTLFATGDNNINFFSLGVFAILVGLWTTNQTMILQVYTQHPEIVRFVNYLCLIFIIYPPVSFLASATKQRNTIFLPILMGLTMVNFITTIALAALGICDIKTMLTFSHVNVVIGIIISIYLMIRAHKKKTVDKSFLRTVIWGLTPSIVGVMIDMVRFRVFLNDRFDASLFTKLGVCVFLVLMSIFLIRERTRFAVEQGQAELMKKMAYTDGLTELANRAAFHEKEEEIRHNHLECVIVQLDINFLKKVNDVFGHAEGDRHIIGASRIIHESFSDFGISYRTGGDEFVVVVQHGGIPEVEQSLRHMEDLVKKYNDSEKPPVPLQIAYGYALCPKQEDMLEEAEKLADKRMYDKKKKMKQD